MFLTDKARAFKEEASLRALSTGVDKLNGAVSVLIHLYRPARRGDIDGPIKLILDCLNEIAYEDDKQIDHLVVYRYDDKNNPRVEIFVRPSEL